MATYFHGAPTEIQPDGLQTLYLMNPGYVGYSSDASASPANMVLLNSTANSLNPANLPQPSQQQQHFMGIPLQAPVPAPQDPNRPPSIHGPNDVSAIHGVVPRLHYNLWTPTPANNSVDMTAQLGLQRASMGMPTQQGLSLSLSPQQPNYALYRPTEPEIHHQPPAPAISPANRDDVRISGSSSSASGASNGISGLQSVLMGSKYLKAAQQLLDEVVNVGKGIKDESPKVAKTPAAKTKAEAEDTGGAETSSKRVAELTTAERQELQMKKAKLVSMLDEVEQRYRQYHHQMQIVVSSFEATAGFGSARTYTALALQTISKQFRCLRDAISGQIRATSKSLGEEDCVVGAGKSEGGSRLRFVDHHLRQQRALQQLGMIQHNAWRPQRGLPERSVSVLRAWLFEHFLHPYPKDSDKHMLAKQTGLTRSQVSNWFINARVRLWKPMVEEMYLEETKEQELLLQNNGDDKTSKSDINDDSASKSSAAQESSPTRTEQTDSLVTVTGQDNPSDPKQRPTPIPSSAGIFRMQAAYDHDAIWQEKLKKARVDDHPNTGTPHSMMNVVAMDLKPDEANNREFFMKFADGRRGAVEDNGYYSFMAAAGGGGGGGGGFGAYPIGDIGRFDPEQFAPRFSGNGVSLTLGLPHCEGLSLSGAQPSYLHNESIPMGRRLEMSSETGDYCSLNNNPSVAHPSNGFENISIQNRKRFAAQLLPDFVA